MTNRDSELSAPPDSSWEEARASLRKVFDPSRAFCAWVEAPFGPVFVAKTRKGVCRVSFRRSEDELLSDLERRALLPEMAPKELDRERRELDEYFQGKRRRFDLPIDIRWGTEFQRSVLDAARRIPFGKSWCYYGRRQRRRSARGAAGGGECSGEEPRAHRHSLPPGGRLRRGNRRLHRGTRHQADVDEDRRHRPPGLSKYRGKNAKAQRRKGSKKKYTGRRGAWERSRGLVNNWSGPIPEIRGTGRRSGAFSKASTASEANARPIPGRALHCGARRPHSCLAGGDAAPARGKGTAICRWPANWPEPIEWKRAPRAARSFARGADEGRRGARRGRPRRKSQGTAGVLLRASPGTHSPRPLPRRADRDPEEGTLRPSLLGRREACRRRSDC